MLSSLKVRLVGNLACMTALSDRSKRSSSHPRFTRESCSPGWMKRIRTLSEKDRGLTRYSRWISTEAVRQSFNLLTETGKRTGVCWCLLGSWIWIAPLQATDIAPMRPLSVKQLEGVLLFPLYMATWWQMRARKEGARKKSNQGIKSRISGLPISTLAGPTSFTAEELSFLSRHRSAVEKALFERVMCMCRNKWLPQYTT